ncbi:uL30 family ribosomal protein [Candidatus Woesearchaeota archaeon]|nr:uL30 family ribosomal protein [Candidatus Woesearchaeota archaeon]
MSELAVVRVRGGIRVDYRILDALTKLNLRRKNACVILPNTPTSLGMLKKAKDYITWGEISEPVKKELLKHADTLPDGTIKRMIRLNPPRKGYGYRGVKKSFTIGGALGDRKDAINDLLKRMM